MTVAGWRRRMTGTKEVRCTETSANETGAGRTWRLFEK